jgi:hypothetical protein
VLTLQNFASEKKVKKIIDEKKVSVTATVTKAETWQEKVLVVIYKTREKLPTSS